MEFLLDSHTHTIASGHAYSTILENARVAADRGLQLLCITDHGPAMSGSACQSYFNNLSSVDRNLFGVDLFMGVELNLMGFDGSLDLPPYILEKLDIIMVCMHTQCMPKGGSREQNTNALIAAMDNPYIDIIGHPDDGQYPLDYPALVRAAGEKEVLLELNNGSLVPSCYRLDAPLHCTEMLWQCMKEEIPIVIGSDAHFATSVGAHNYAEILLKELNFPAELVLNTDPERFRAFLAHKRNLRAKQSLL